MRSIKIFFTSVLVMTALGVHAQDSVQHTDIVKSNGTGNIDLFKDVTAPQLEQLRLDNNGTIVLAIDVNEDASGTEKSSSQGAALKSHTMTIDYSDSTQSTYDLDGGCCSTEMLALLAEASGNSRQLYFTMLGDTGSNRITANNVIQNEFDSTIKIDVPVSLYDPSPSKEAVSAIVEIVLLQTNESLGDPEAFYDYSNGFEDLAILNAADSAFLDDYAAGRDEAPTVILTNPPEVIDPLAVANWNYFPTATSYFLVRYEDPYPGVGDYDFNDLSVAYHVNFGLNQDNQVVSIRGVAYLLTRGAGYTYNWRFRIGMPATASGTLQCLTFVDPLDVLAVQASDPAAPTSINGTADFIVFSDTSQISQDPGGSIFASTFPDRTFSRGPKSEFRIDLDTPLDISVVASAPFDPYLHVVNTGKDIQLLQVNPDFKDANGFPFGMLMPIDWLPPHEFVEVGYACPYFADFVASEGTQALNWYSTYFIDQVVNVPAVSSWAW